MEGLIHINWIALFVASLIPFVTGFIFYHPKVAGTKWMVAAGLTEEQLKGANMGLIFGVSFILNFMIAFGIQFFVIHQWGMIGVLMGGQDAMNPSSEAAQTARTLFEKYGNNFRTFRHGAMHGGFAGLLIASAIIGVNSMFERRSFSYILINGIYWIITLALVGGLVCAWV
ncbi:MAG: DUF1761 domain-containing protein [Saprospiraceae bacterium]|jgi:hypothetical protein|nr:DUF1761 domain-containing protein [Saprospiraceae bacterium]MBK7796394.1 DUF1761 domain-containing protein [Saprospiraceae bacterium]MBL0260218.1 DUF1761 domain-containing protein [Saprospiraceae bacterium]